jgi:hypothetical protein
MYRVCYNLGKQSLSLLIRSNKTNMAATATATAEGLVVIERLVPGMFTHSNGQSLPLWSRETVSAAEAERIRQKLEEDSKRAFSTMPTVRIVGPLTSQVAG